MAAPVVLISSCSDFDANSIVRGILGTDELPEPTSHTAELPCYLWSIDTKYYTATAHLCPTTTKTIGDQDFARSVQAVILYFDPYNKTTFDLVKSWLPFVKEIDPEIKLLVTERCSDDTPHRNEYMEWCIEYEFELIETNPDVDSDDDFAEPRGYKRIISALHAHTWPNLVLKDCNNSFRSPYMQMLGAEGACAIVEEEEVEEEKGAKEVSEKGTKEVSEKSMDSDMAELLEALGNEDPGDESFESLFERMKLMKEKAESLPEEERREYAERIAIQFMKAMGGDEEDLGLSSDDET